MGSGRNVGEDACMHSPEPPCKRPRAKGINARAGRENGQKVIGQGRTRAPEGDAGGESAKSERSGVEEPPPSCASGVGELRRPPPTRATFGERPATPCSSRERCPEPPSALLAAAEPSSSQESARSRPEPTVRSASWTEFRLKPIPSSSRSVPSAGASAGCETDLRGERRVAARSVGETESALADADILTVKAAV